MTAEARTTLDRAVAKELASGAELESQAGTNAVLLKGKKVNHVLHAILSLITAGFWLIVWLILVVTNKRQRIILSVNERGEVERQIRTV